MVTLSGTTETRSVECLGCAGLLLRRLAGMGLLHQEIACREPELFEYLRLSCAACEWPDLCEWDLRHGWSDPAWGDYCPNAVVLNALSELPGFRADRPDDAASATD